MQTSALSRPPASSAIGQAVRASLDAEQRYRSDRRNTERRPYDNPVPGLVTESSSARAVLRSAVSKPSLNRSYTG